VVTCRIPVEIEPLAICGGADAVDVEDLRFITFAVTSIYKISARLQTNSGKARVGIPTLPIKTLDADSHREKQRALHTAAALMQ
jgi:hypothetical protein